MAVVRKTEIHQKKISALLGNGFNGNELNDSMEEKKKNTGEQSDRTKSRFNVVEKGKKNM